MVIPIIMANTAQYLQIPPHLNPLPLGRGIIEETACRSLKIFVSQKENRPIRVQRHAG